MDGGVSSCTPLETSPAHSPRFALLNGVTIYSVHLHVHDSSSATEERGRANRTRLHGRSRRAARARAAAPAGRRGAGAGGDARGRDAARRGGDTAGEGGEARRGGAGELRDAGAGGGVACGGGVGGVGGVEDVVDDVDDAVADEDVGHDDLGAVDEDGVAAERDLDVGAVEGLDGGVGEEGAVGDGAVDDVVFEDGGQG